jgi:cytochrome b subunit of formate dehydrogenase
LSPSPTDVEKHAVSRYTTGARMNHWLTAICLILLAISGLALFSPSLFPLTALFGGGTLTRETGAGTQWVVAFPLEGA